MASYFIVCLIGAVLICVGLCFKKRHQDLIKNYKCEWCKKGISYEDRNRFRDQIMCPHCWEFTRVIRDREFGHSV